MSGQIPRLPFQIGWGRSGIRARGRAFRRLRAFVFEAPREANMRLYTDHFAFGARVTPRLRAAVSRQGPGPITTIGIARRDDVITKSPNLQRPDVGRTRT